MREERGARGAEQARLLQAQHFSRVNHHQGPPGSTRVLAEHQPQLRGPPHPADGGAAGKCLTFAWKSGVGCRVSLGNMETVIHQRVIIRLLTTFTPEIRTAPESGRADWTGRWREELNTQHSTLGSPDGRWPGRRRTNCPKKSSEAGLVPG